jgi:hypothetical protein
MKHQLKARLIIESEDQREGYSDTRYGEEIEDIGRGVKEVSEGFITEREVLLGFGEIVL